MDPRFQRSPHIVAVDTPAAALRFGRSTGVPTSRTTPAMVPARTTGPMVQTTGGPVTKVTFRSYAEALKQWPHATMWTADVQGTMAAIRSNWRSDFENDPQIGGANRDRTVAKGTALIAHYGKEMGAQHAAALRSVLDDTGAGDHPAMLRFADWMSGKMMRPTVLRGSAHDRTYGPGNGKPAAARPKGSAPAASKAKRLFRHSVPA